MSSVLTRSIGGRHVPLATEPSSGTIIVGWSIGILARIFIFSLVPIAIAYHLSHLLSFFLIFGQLIIPLASDPFGFGWDLFGTADFATDIGIVGPRFIWTISVIAIVVGHVAAVYLAHVTAIRSFADRRLARISRYPMLVLMVGYTMISPVDSLSTDRARMSVRGPARRERKERCQRVG